MLFLTYSFILSRTVFFLIPAILLTTLQVAYPVWSIRNYCVLYFRCVWFHLPLNFQLATVQLSFLQTLLFFLTRTLQKFSSFPFVPFFPRSCWSCFCTSCSRRPSALCLITFYMGVICNVFRLARVRPSFIP